MRADASERDGQSVRGRLSFLHARRSMLKPSILTPRIGQLCLSSSNYFSAISLFSLPFFIFFFSFLLRHSPVIRALLSPSSIHNHGRVHGFRLQASDNDQGFLSIALTALSSRHVSVRSSFFFQCNGRDCRTQHNAHICVIQRYICIYFRSTASD